MSRPTRNVKKDNNPYGAGAFVNPDDIDLDENSSDSSTDARAPAKRRPGRPKKEDTGAGPAAGGRRNYAADLSQAGFVDPYEHITTSRPFGGMVIYNSERDKRPVKNPHVYL